MPTSSPSNIRAFVQWREPSVYAGEEIECIITFKNVAAVPGQDAQEEDRAPGLHANGHSRAPSAVHSRRSSLAHNKLPPGRAASIAGGRQVPPTRGHRPTLSLNVVSASSRGALHSAGLHSAPLNGRTPTTARPGKGHGRSLSIMSLGSEAPSEGRTSVATTAGKRPARGHGRSASAQVVSRPSPFPMPSPGFGLQNSRQPSPLYESSTPPALAEAQSAPMPIRPPRRRPGTISAGNTPQLGSQNGFRRSPGPTGSFSPEFEFPPKQPSSAKRPSPERDPSRPPRSPSNMHSGQHRGVSPRPPDGWSGALGNLNPVSRIMSESSADGTPRTSSDFYSGSNHSDETVISELPYQSPASGRLLPRPTHSRQASSRSIYTDLKPKLAGPESLMMGFAQTMGHFTLDGSLVNAAPFEEVKRKGVQGGGGVVGVERPKRQSGMFGALSWGNLGESIGGLLGDDNMSSMAQMKAAAGSKIVPLLTTPQSLLFVDLRLAPGQSKSYHYRFTLPRGLPPSHRGRAIKVNYHLSIGIQRPEGQAVKHIEIPFRVLGSVNGQGEILGHDLMSPYILLQDAARAQSISSPAANPDALPVFPSKDSAGKSKLPSQGLEDFLRYTERLLETPTSTDSHGALLSPTSPTGPPLSPTLSRSRSIAEPPPGTTREAIDFAILRANQTSHPTRNSEAQSSNRFNIARSGQSVAILTLVRPAYRLGEAVIGTIDFVTPDPSTQSPTYAIHLELESAERIDPSLALRSSSSIQRVTRKVHASARENALFARSVSYNLTIPSHATPTFETTGVSLLWKLRVEFTMQRLQQAQGSGFDEGFERGEEELLEEVGRDERGTGLLARERLVAETFEIAVPLKVFGAQGVEGLGVEVEALEF